MGSDISRSVSVDPSFHRSSKDVVEKQNTVNFCREWSIQRVSNVIKRYRDSSVTGTGNEDELEKTIYSLAEQLKQYKLERKHSLQLIADESQTNISMLENRRLLDSMKREKDTDNVEAIRGTNENVIEDESLDYVGREKKKDTGETIAGTDANIEQKVSTMCKKSTVCIYFIKRFSKFCRTSTTIYKKELENSKFLLVKRRN